MLKKTLFFRTPSHLSCRLDQLLVHYKDKEMEKSIPMEDIAYLVIEHPQITFTMKALQKLIENNAAVVFCDERHYPASMLLAFEGHHIQTQRFHAQLSAGPVLKKQLWKEIVKDKIRNQSALLEYRGKDAKALKYKATKVLSGDSSNEEAKAARMYWYRLFGPDFIRARFGKPPNAALNYAYAILRSACARALTGSGLLPSVGIHHRNKYNAFCLADDIMEPYRPFADLLVLELIDRGLNADNLGQKEKALLLKLPAMDTLIDGRKRPLIIALSSTTSSLSRTFEGVSRKLLYPQL